MLRAQVPDLHISVEDVIAEGDKVVTRYTLAQCFRRAVDLWGNAWRAHLSLRAGLQFLTAPASQVAALWLRGSACAAAAV